MPAVFGLVTGTEVAFTGDGNADVVSFGVNDGGFLTLNGDPDFDLDENADILASDVTAFSFFDIGANDTVFFEGSNPFNFSSLTTLSLDVLDADSVSINTGVSTAGGDIFFATVGDVAVNAPLASTGILTFLPFDPDSDIGIGNASGTLNLTDTELAFLADGFSEIEIGDVEIGTGTVDVDTAVFLDPVIIAGGVIHDNNGTDVTAPDVTFVGDVAPGQSPGVLNVAGDVFLDGSSFEVEIGGTTPGTSQSNHDQLAATGSVDIGSDVFLDLQPFGSFTPSEGDSFTIISRNGGGGTFRFLPEGAAFGSFLGSSFDAVITYAGGDGDDVVITVGTILDYGDAPDTGPGTGPGNYQTTAADNGPGHGLNEGLSIGIALDTEIDGLPNATATGDDANQVDDEDGIANALSFVGGEIPQVDVTFTNLGTGPATLYGWIDYNGDGVFDNATERAQVAVPGGRFGEVVVLTFPQVPANAVANTFARFRLSTDPAAANPTGFAFDGEVEDYAVTIQQEAITITSSANAQGLLVTPTLGTSFSVEVATFVAGAEASASDFSATIAWGDGTTSAGTITANSDGSFSVTGTQTYFVEDTFTVNLTIAGVQSSVQSTIVVGSAVVLTPGQSGQLQQTGFSVANPGQQVTTGVNGLSATLVLPDGSPLAATLFVAKFANNPEVQGVTAVGFYDVRLRPLNGAAQFPPGTQLTLTFDYSDSPGAVNPGLLFFNDLAQSYLPVFGSQVTVNSLVSDPQANTITVVLDLTSLPSVNNLGGTVFVVASGNSSPANVSSGFTSPVALASARSSSFGANQRTSLLSTRRGRSLSVGRENNLTFSVNAVQDSSVIASQAERMRRNTGSSEEDPSISRLDETDEVRALLEEMRGIIEELGLELDYDDLMKLPDGDAGKPELGNEESSQPSRSSTKPDEPIPSPDAAWIDPEAIRDLAEPAADLIEMEDVPLVETAWSDAESMRDARALDDADVGAFVGILASGGVATRQARRHKRRRRGQKR